MRIAGLEAELPTTGPDLEHQTTIRLQPRRQRADEGHGDDPGRQGRGQADLPGPPGDLQYDSRGQAQRHALLQATENLEVEPVLRGGDAGRGRRRGLVGEPDLALLVEDRKRQVPTRHAHGQQRHLGRQGQGGRQALPAKAPLKAVMARRQPDHRLIATAHDRQRLVPATDPHLLGPGLTIPGQGDGDGPGREDPDVETEPSPGSVQFQLQPDRPGAGPALGIALQPGTAMGGFVPQDPVRPVRQGRGHLCDGQRTGLAHSGADESAQ